MIIEVNSTEVGQLRLRLVRKTALSSSGMPCSYYLTSDHAAAGFFTVIEYAGHDLAHSERKFARTVEKARADAEEECVT